MNNKYILPVHLKDLVRIDRTTSPAHIGKLKNSIDFEFVKKDGDFSVVGKEILAIADGEVIDLKEDSNIGGPDKKFMNDGNWIEIKHEEGIHSFYEHFKHKGVLVQIGEKVQQGQVIGLSGHTGFTFSSHLHFELRKYKGNPEHDNFITLKIFPELK